MLVDNEDAWVEAMRKDLHRHPYEAITTDLAGCKAELIDMLNNVDTWSQGEAPAGAGLFLGTLGKAWLRKEPLGVSLIIGAWNFPLYTLLAPALASLAAGNCVMLKPSESASATQDLLAELVPKYLDQSAIRIITGGAQETGHILEHKFNHIFYTGGSKVGRVIATAAAKHLTPTVLELGGQAPAIVTKSANIDLAAKRIAHAKLTNSGQICLNVNHVFADPTIHDELVNRMTYWIKEWLKEGTDYLAYIISDNHYTRITNLLSKTNGTITYTGPHNNTTRFLHPTIITNISQTDSLMSEELFASLIPILHATTDEAISSIQSLPHPLGLYIFSTNKSEINHILNSTTSGGVTINDVMIHAGVPGAPFGGVGESGHGSYRGKWGFDSFSHTRVVVEMPNWVEWVLGWRYAPYRIENRSYVDNHKVGFKRGEGLEDQKVGGVGGAGWWGFGHW